MRVYIYQYIYEYGITKHMRVSAWRKGRGCRITGRRLVFTLISHRVSRGCQTLRPPPCGAPSFHRIRASRVPISSLLFLWYLFFLGTMVPRMYVCICTYEGDFTKLYSSRSWKRLSPYVCHNICNAVYGRALVIVDTFLRSKKGGKNILNFQIF